MATQALRWARPVYAGYLFTEIWRSDTELADVETATVEAGAVKIGEASSNVWFDTGLTRGATKYYYLRHVNSAGEKTDFVAKTAMVEDFTPEAFGAQPVNALLTALAALTWEGGKGIAMSGDDTVETFALTAAAKVLLAAADAAGQRGALGLGTLAVLGSVNNDNWSGADLAVAHGGTGASSPGAARSGLGLGSIATQAKDAVDIDGGTIDGTPVGGTVPAAGKFTSLAANGKLSLGEGPELTIASGEITITHAIHVIDTESDAASDDLVTINGGVAGVGDIVFLRLATGSRKVVVKHATGNIRTASAVDVTLSKSSMVAMLVWVGTFWCLVVSG